MVLDATYGANLHMLLPPKRPLFLFPVHKRRQPIASLSSFTPVVSSNHTLGDDDLFLSLLWYPDNRPLTQQAQRRQEPVP